MATGLGGAELQHAYDIDDPGLIWRSVSLPLLLLARAWVFLYYRSRS
jgi:hypothetical protein